MVAKRIFAFFLFFSLALNAQVSVGSGSYSTSFPGADSAGRNAYPSGTPYVSGVAANKPIPTNDWWSKLVKQGNADNLFNYPFTMKTLDTGLIVSYIPWGVIGDSAPIEVGLSGLSTNKITVSDHTDWTVTMDWTSGDKNLSVTSGVGMPFLYFEKSEQEEVSIKVNSGNTTIQNNKLIIENASHGADFVVFAPSGSTWTKNGSIYNSSLNGKNYWSMSMLPQSNTNLQVAIDEIEPYAFVFPTDTQVSWSYNESNAKLSSTYTITSEVKEGSTTQFYQGLLPHHWANLSGTSSTPNGPSYSTIRGEMKILKGNTFSLEHYFTGILPTLPNLVQYSDSFDIGEMVRKVQDLENSGLDLWTDSYNEGQLMNRLVQTARIAHEIGLSEARDKLLATVKERLEDWLSYSSGEVAFMFYYQPQWTSLIGYPAGHGQDSNINDHHFHWGYFIHAASFVEQFEPGWLSQWGGMIELLVRDAATADRDDEMFPFLRNFSPFAGHSWANGFASFPQGNDQESTSESMQFNSSLIHYGSISGNKEIRDLGIFLYMTEKTAIDEYWLDVNERNFSSSQNYSLVSRVWGNSYDNGTFWTADITASYGIEMYPIHGGSYYLASNQNYITKLWSEIESNTDILNPNSTNPNLWYDTFWKFLSMSDPQKALELYELSPNRNLKFGISDAQTYYWLHSANAIGKVRPDITASHPIAIAFEKDSKVTYIAHNYSSEPITVAFSDGYELLAAPGQMTTSEDVAVSGQLTTDFESAYANSTVDIKLSTQNQDLSKVEFYSSGELLFTDDTAPYEYKTNELSLGRHTYYARMYVGSQYELSNPLEIRVGEQNPYQGEMNQIPGIIQAGNYDEFEGGNGQNISYLDLSNTNNGDYRTDEYVDSEFNANEGATVGWIDSGEWLEYTVDIQQSGYYNLSFRYASGNSNGGGPFRILLDGKAISSPINVSSTSTSNWNTFRTAEVSNLSFVEGDHVLRLEFEYGEFNLGEMEFSYDRALDYDFIVADAGENRSIILPETTTVLDGSNTTSTGEVDYQWTQIYGPSLVNFENENLLTTTVSNLQKGVYKFRLEVSSSVASDYDEVILAVNDTGNQPPAITFVSPSDNSTFKEGESILLKTRVSDLDGSVDSVKFYVNDNFIQELSSAPFEIDWTPTQNGDYTLTAVAVDDQGLETQSEPISITVETVKQCVSSGSNAQQGSFSIGYKATFETVGTSVTVTFELLDTDKSGVIAYLWQESPFQELELEQVADRVFSKTISGLTPGQEISYAAKFAFTGGLSVTPYVKYVVGSDCSSNEQDTAPPTNFSASISSINSTSVSFDLYAEDNSGELIYTISQNGVEQSFSGVSSETTTVTYTGLSEQTNYSFVLSVQDKNGNISSTQKNLEATTIGSNEQDTAPPTNFSASISSINSTSVSFDLYAEDNSGELIYTISQNGVEQSFSGVSSETTTVTYTGLSEQTNYSFVLSVQDKNGNISSTQKNLEATTIGSNEQDTAPPTNFSASISSINSTSVSFDLYAEDNSGELIYTISQNGVEQSFSGVSSETTTVTYTGLSEQTNYSFVLSVQDKNGNISSTQKNLEATTIGSNEQDTAPPTNFSASISSINSTSVSFDLYAEDNSGELIYTISQNGVEQSFSGVSSETTTVTYTGLSEQTNYSFVLSVQDKNGNISSTQKNLEATTIESTNNSCSGESADSQQGSFTLGYKYSFKTEGSQVIIEFELLDDRPDLIAYLWKKDPFTETSMSSVGSRTFRATLTNQTVGSTISYAVKFAFAGGLAVTKYFDYVVGDNCVVIDDEDNDGVEDAVDQCLDTPAGVAVNTSGCEVFALPVNTFTVSVTSATCPDSSNGSITISSSNTDYSYRYAIDDQAPQTLTDNTQTISNLSAGIYTVCVTVDGVSDYNVCYTIEIKEPAPLVASSRVDVSSRNLQLDLSGSSEYQITLNGKSFLTTDTNLSLNLVPGMNRVEVATSLDCQGVYFEEIFVSEEVKVYPNPTAGPLQLFVAGSDREIEMSITSLSGNVIRRETLSVPTNRIIETTLGNLPEGLYLITLKGNTVKTTHKIIKE